MTYNIYGITKANAAVKADLIRKAWLGLERIKYIAEYWAVVTVDGMELEVGFDDIDATAIVSVTKNRFSVQEV